MKPSRHFKFGLAVVCSDLGRLAQFDALPRERLPSVQRSGSANRPWGTLPLKLRPSQTCELSRFGGSGDGGYLISEHDVMASDGLISMGIDRNWRFERHFRRVKSVPIHAYDGSTSTSYLLQETKRALVARNWRWAARSLINVADYNWFFSRRSVRHYRQFVRTNEFAYQDHGVPTVELSSVVQSMKDAGSSKVFLKIDIEGTEYLLLDELLEIAPLTTGLAIEFHDCDRRVSQIVSFVERYPLTLVHIHANTYGGVGNGEIPVALELSFSSSAAASDNEPILPHPLDEPNDGGVEILLKFSR